MAEPRVVIGLETHVQLNTLKSKMFCGCSTEYHDAEPNTHVCPVCLGLPGSLPVLNEGAVEAAIRVALALDCQIGEWTQFYRKNYYYPDLPKGFQISQYDYPIGKHGHVEIEGDEGTKSVGITRVHMEEDPGRLVHLGSIEHARYTLVDYNRSGMPLLEVVSEPDLSSPKEARRYLDKLRSILEYLEVFDADKEGAMRVDANISLEGGTRVEIKNISSHKGVERALHYEIVRQKNALRRGSKIVQETRHFDEARGVTVSLRTKERAEDYRYFPEPDLVPLRIKEEWVSNIAKSLPELPDEKRERFIAQYGIAPTHARSLTSDIRLANLFERVAGQCDPALSAAWIADVIKGELNYRGLPSDALDAAHIVDVLKMLQRGEISDRAAVQVIRTCLDENLSPEQVVEREGLRKAGEDELKPVVERVLADNQRAVSDYFAGKPQAINYLVGQVMSLTKGRADPKVARRLLEERLNQITT
ncbi:Asp-tRNA(Asn)/Glu-tRNA(Gln) amidotransferase subunit GatB [Methermicoccus shengliensis]|uniref:Aspartyl/glutamyl-tRNA(Asn/Gln) amidotransferase subunit B n=1 Tax=Methermicoccus shengliensis TaxID=660064 RepID=A0A832RU95_9EURY|nr:Asp-tRNA(Asn)/Glu-tRNA(Gln) amidotransferase subunit GatB [Methermicoccus shengliensis]KUK05065.1 MAG: Aspartyl/glutamyl-tRNA(Asn/Gln) amidotransferase subunit B [Euryarchaeota archaeon 55_53]KUK30358.1 MAG: Aspartyl/glutamyl-tRNA(Asn/Gln) amidotransferase subunit B [Methanosarcinales archeaon 56_1174]MDI3487551.1 aspartyl-tRNA(Asn)/glutamyl-tRNA(Gln) amidotransferase subunit [Methanosarcinales archaeon]MDN5294700.1 aspartyl-tRNA(Asn)/glutamyl-tRNA(Gln) amidotransferase subunit [Methanosarci